ncbi:MAG: 4Fe-4S dicluster domain-containing protein, partial [Myxococcota bacterium]
RSPMLEQFFGPELTQAHVELKQAFDPKGVFNPGKIVEPKAIDADWRFTPGQELPHVDTLFDWSLDGGLIRAVEKCNGAGVCRKTADAGGTMCPSYMVTLEEKDSTRGRANVFRNLFLNNEDPRTALASQELYEVMDLCLSCKGCKSECPASVDMTRMKTEFLQHHHDAHGAPLSARLFAQYGRLSKLASWVPWLANFTFTFTLTRWIMGKLLNLATQRSMPTYAPRTFSSLHRKWRREHPADRSKPVVGLYVDPFCEFTEPEIGMATVRVLEACGWRVERVPIEDDGRTQLSKGFVRDARRLSEKNVQRATVWMGEHPEAKIVGVEPSALLTFRDEVPDLVSPEFRAGADELAQRCLLLDEFITQHQGDDAFTSPFGGVDGEPLILHGHCHQKAIVGVSPTVEALTLAGYDVTALKTGCCGMAGSFGYERDHYELSMAVGELALFPAVRDADDRMLIAAPGTSCRHQILDGTGRVAEHPAVLLERALARA